MELFSLLFILLGIVITTSAQVILGAIAALEFVIELIEGAEVLATFNANIALTITGDLLEGEGELGPAMYFNTEVQSGLVTVYSGTTQDMIYSFNVEGLSGGFTQNVALGETSAVSGNFGWSQAIQYPGEDWTVVLDGQWGATVNVDATGSAFDVTEGSLSGVEASIQGPRAEFFDAELDWDLDIHDEFYETASEGGDD
jgi:hypothetical protein